jgi:hypothetical protein
MPSKARYWRGRCNAALRRLEERPDMDPLTLYGLAFGAKAADLSLWGFDPGQPRVAELLLRAVRRGRPFRYGHTVSRLCGGWRNTPPPDVEL